MHKTPFPHGPSILYTFGLTFAKIPANWLPLALPAMQLSTLADGLLSFSALASERELAPDLYSSSNCRTRASGQERRAQCRDHICSKREDRRGVSQHLRV